jgi:hypothetical protein
MQNLEYNSMSLSPLPADSSSYVPTAPFSVTYDSVLSQDVVMTDSVVADSTSAAPVAPFVNTLSPLKTSPTEALVVSNSKLNHVSRNTASDGGWTLTPLSNESTVTEVAAGTAYAGTPDAGIYAVYQDATALNVIQLQSDGATWSNPIPMQNAALSSLRSAYSPGGRLVFYAQTASGDLFVAYQPSAGAVFATQTYSMPSPLGGDYCLCMTDEQNWTLAGNMSSVLTISTGALDGTSTSPSSSGAAGNYDGNINQVVLGYWSDYQAALMFLFVDSANNLQVWASSGGIVTPVPPAITGSTVTLARAHVYVDPDTGIDTVHVYTLDDQGNLSVLHQDPDMPWNTNGVPNWAAYIPLDTGIGGLAIDASPADVPSLFALASDDYSLRLHQQDNKTQMWQTQSVLQTGTAGFEVTRFRAEINIADSSGMPVPQKPVAVTLSPGYSAADLWVDGTIYPIDSQNSIPLCTDAMGKLTLAVLVTESIVAPELLLSLDGLPGPFTVQPAAGVHTYLSGNGKLNPTNPLNPASGAGPLPTFDSAGGTLANATVNGTKLAPGVAGNATLAGVAAKAIQQAAGVGLGKTPPPGIAGYKVDLSADQPTFHLISTQDELEHHVAGLLSQRRLGSFFSKIGHFFSDLWTGIKNGVVAIKNFVIDTANKVVTLTVQIANDIESGIQLALSGLEQAGHFIAGVFRVVEAGVEDVVDWLKAVFDFGAIFRTQAALEAMVVAWPTWAANLAKSLEAPVNGWFSQQEATINGKLQQLAHKYSGQTFGQQPNAQPPGMPQQGGPPIAGNASPADFTSNAHHNWLYNKVHSYTPSDGNMGLQDDGSFAGAWTGFSGAAQNSSSGFNAALQNFSSAVENFIKDPSSFNSIVIPDLINAVQGLVDSLLQFADGVAEGFLSFISDAMSTLADLLSKEIEISALQSLWKWLQEKAGVEDPAPLTVSSLFSLLVAFPVTIAYKLVAGVDDEPFPAQAEAKLGSGPLGPTRKTILASAIIHLVSAIPGVFSDILGPSATPRWVSVFILVFAIVDWVTFHGLPTETQWQGLGAVTILLMILNTIFRTCLYTVYARLTDYLDANPGVIIPALLTAHGTISFILGVVDVFVDDLDVAQIFSYLLEPLSSLFSFVNLPYFRDDPEDGPFAVAVKLEADFYGYVGGGVAELVDAAMKLHSDDSLGRMLPTTA